MIISSWNVNSVRARIENIKSYLLKYKPDVIMMQEIKTEDINFPYDDFLALEENNFKMEYINNMYQTGQQVEQGYSSKLREVQSMKKELISDKQKKVQELYRDLGREVTKQINR